MNNLVSLVVSYAVNASWQVPLVACAAWVAASMLRRVGPRAQHIVWVTALVGMAVLPAVPRFHWPAHHAATTVSMSYDDIDLASLPPLAPAPQPLWDAQSGIAALPRLFFLALLCGYLAAGVYFALRLGWWLWRTRVLVREADPVEFGETAKGVWLRCRDAFLLGDVSTLESSEMRSPVTVGLRQPALLMPEGFSERASSEELMTALAHECAHVQRKDFIKNVVYEIVSLPIAFHPVLWMVKRQIAETREMVCDGMAVERVVDVPRYVRSLLRLAEGVVGPPVSSAAMGMFDGRTLERRILSMRERRRQLAPWARVALMLPGVLVLVGAALGGASLAVGVEAKAVPPPATTIAMQSASAPAAANQEQTPPQDSVALNPEEKARLQQEIKDLRSQLKALVDQSRPDSEERRKLAETVRQTQAELASGDFQEKLRAMQADALKLQEQQKLWQKEIKPFTEEQLKQFNSLEFQQKLQAMQAGALKMQQDGRIRLKFTPEQLEKFRVETEQMVQEAQRQQALSVEDRQRLVEKQKELIAKALSFQESFKAQQSVFREERAQQDKALFAQLEARLKAQQKNALKAGASPQAMANQAPTGPVKISSAIVSSTRISGDDPVYPPIARAAHVQGAVVLHAIIARDGAVQKTDVISGPQMLQNAAIKAVNTWRYKPYLLNGEPTEVETTITVNFALPEANPPGASATPPPASDRPVRISGGTIAGSRLSGTDPSYPKEAKEAHVQGSVVLHAIISKTGTVENLEVISGPELLQMAAMNAVKTWQYRPYLLNGQPTEVDTTITVNFTINGDATRPQDMVRHVGGGVSAPQVINSVSPEMTEEARKAKFDGNVVVYLVVDQQGLPQQAHIIKPLSVYGLDAAAIKAVEQYRFRPAMENGRPVPVELSIEVDFKVF